MERSSRKVKGLFKQPQSNNYLTKVKGQVLTTGTPDFTEALRILKIRHGQAAEGYPILKRADQIKYEEAAEDLKRHYTTTKTRDLEEAGYRFQHLDTHGSLKFSAVAKIVVRS